MIRSTPHFLEHGLGLRAFLARLLVLSLSGFMVGCAELPQQTTQPPVLRTLSAQALTPDAVAPTRAQPSSSLSTPSTPSTPTPEAASRPTIAVTPVITTDQAVVITTSTPWWHNLGDPLLTELITRAIKDQATIHHAQARLMAAAGVERLAELQTGLQYDTTASLQRQRLSDHGLLPSALIGKMYTQGSLAQRLALDLDWWGRNRALLQAAHQDNAASAAELAAAQQALAAAVADAYYAWAATQRALRLGERMLALQAELTRLQGARLHLGLEAEAAMRGAQLAEQQSAQQVEQLKYASARWRYRLAALAGLEPTQSATLAVAPLPRQLPVQLASLPKKLTLDALAQRPDVASLRSRLQAASARTDATTAEFYPSIDLGLMLGFESLELDQLLNTSSLVAGAVAAVHLPIFNGRSLRARLGVREAEYAQAVASYNHSLLEAARQSADAYALNNMLELRAAQQALSLQHARRLHELARTRNQLGLETPLARLQAELAYYQQAQLDSELLGQRLRARIALYHALGSQPGAKDAS